MSGPARAGRSASAMPRTIEGKLSADGLKVAVVVSRFNAFVTEELLKGALDALHRHGAKDGDLDIVRCPGAFELPPVARRMSQTGQYDAIVVLGAIIRGGTPHFDYLAALVTRSLGQLALESTSAVSFGVLTCDTVEQAIERSGTKAGNKGFEAAVAAIETANVLREIGSGRKR